MSGFVVPSDVVEFVRSRADEADRSARFPRESIDALAKAGLFGLCVPKEFGGRGEGPRAFAAVVETLAQACGSAAMIYVMHVTATQAIASGRRSTAIESTLRDIAAGGHLTTLAFSEKGSRSHFWAPVSRLEQSGAHLRVTAFKSWVTSANHAQSFVSSAQRPGASSPLESTLYLARPGGPNLSVVGTFDGLGLRGNDSAPVTLEGYEVSEDALLTDHGAGAKAMLEVVLPWFSIGTSAMAMGLCRAATGATAKHLQAGAFEHTGSSLRDLPNLRARLAEMSVRTEQAAALLQVTLGHLEQPTETTPLFVLQTRLAALQAAVDVTDLAMKTCGGAAFSRHLGIERMFRDARAGWVMAPTADHLQDFIGRALTGLPLF